MTRDRTTWLWLLLLVRLGAYECAYLPEELQEARTPEPKSIEDRCSAGCESVDDEQVEGDDAGAEVSCGLRCRVDHCSVGCLVWREALNSSCHKVCNATQKLLYVKELYCTIGCQNAVNQYFKQAKAKIGVPPTPVLVKDSLAETSLTLKWDNASLGQRDFRVLYFAQWRHDNAEGRWQYGSYQTWNGNNQIFIHNLQPYTSYRFRLAITLTSAQDEADEASFSEPSERVLTFPRGPPASAPVILKALAIDHSRIYVNWKPGPFTNGPLYSYVLRLQQRGHEAFQLKDIPITHDSFMFQNLEANTNYSVALTMRNSEGEGPSTSTFVTTLLEPEANSSDKPSLIVTSGNKIFRPGMESSPLVWTAERIRDSVVYFADSRLYLCDSSDRLYVAPIDGTANPELVLLLDPNTTDFRPWSLSVDWLGSRLFVAGSNDTTEYWEIGVTGLDGGNVTELLTELMSQPKQLEVDPYNGYLFWLTGEGIYRVDLGELGRKPEPEPQLILKKQHLGAFLVDYANRRLLVAYKSENTVKSVSLDGKIIVDVRVNAKQPKFKNASSISMANGLFYWTNGPEVFAESYEPNDFRFFHSVLFTRDGEDSFVKLQVVADERQPTPIPARPPTRVQGLALADRARISWRGPELLPGQSPMSAWSNWSYSLVLEDDVNGEMIQVRDIRGTERVVDELRDGSVYSVKIAARSRSGEGPWSEEFKIRTLRKDLEASILWTTRDAVLQSDLIGEGVRTLVDVTQLDSDKRVLVVDLAWHEDLLLIVGDNSRVYAYNATSRQKSLMRHAASANRVAFDWIARKIYWADEKKRIVLRSHLDGSHREPVAIAGVVQRLLIDSLEAHLYWSTSRTVEVVRLNGEDRRQYRSEDDFDGRRVSGLTLDLDNRYVYWIVGDTEDDFKLYRSLTADNLPTDQDILPEVVSTIRNTIGNSLSYVSDRFFFLDSTRSALTTDAHGKFTATISNISDHSSLLSLFVRGPLPSVPKNLTPIAVRPGKVNVSSIAIVGTWRDFSVTWQPVTGPNYGRIFYEVSFTDYINVNTQPVTTSRTTLGYANADQLLPYSLLEVTIRAYTYWDAAPRVSRVLRSPQSVPSQPADPRVFVESFKDPLAESVDYFATFRWGMPEFGNGPVLGFTIQCWILVDGAEVLICDSVNVTVSELEYTVHNLRAATAYYFQVRAFAEVGAGPFTDTVSVSTENENPVPQLLVATMEDVKKIDLDERSNITITRHIAVEVANLAAEAKIFWINEMQELVTADADGRSITKILTLNNTALSLCADWISRSVFWTESDMESGLSHVMKLDITVWEAGDYEYSRILTRNRRIVNLDIAPLTGNLFWFELSTSSLGFVMQSDLDGENVQPFFNHTEDCSCPFKPMIQPVFTIDNTDPSSPVVYWISDEGQLFIADIEGCICSLVVQPGPDRGLPPTSLTTDKRYIYWSNRDTGKIHYTDKNGFGDSMTIKDYLINDTRSIRAIGKSLQPYPEPDCLIPQRAQYNVQQVSRSSSSITVRLPEAQAYLGCEKYKLPATKYIIDVAECDRLEDPQNERLCENGTKHQTYTREFEVRGLKPFTKYRFRLTLTNYYSDQEFAEIDQYGAGLLLKTDVGPPSSPENLEVRALTPNLASVEWSPPELWNADFVRYKVFWRSANGTLLGEKQVKDGDASTYLQPLTPGQKYGVHVRAYPENYTDMFSRSDEKILNMHPEPNDLTLSGVSSVAINVTWLPARDLLADYALEFAEGDRDTWRTVDRAAQVSGRLVYQVSNLLSKKLYKFRLILKYRGSTINYVWPNDDRFTFQTLEDIPTAPGVPLLVKSQNSNHRIRWEPAKSLHSKNLFYHLQGRTIDADDPGNVTNEWITLYNGTDDFWDVPRNMRQKYVFRTRAWNDYGFGNWSETSPVVHLSEMTRALMIAQEHLGLILGVGVAILTLVLFCVFLCPLNKKSKEEQQQKLKKKKKAPIKLKPHVELATLREIPRGNFVEANSLYVAAVETDASDSLSPKIQREQISLAKFLGKGAFGEVFQGVVKDIQGPGSMTPIAVKTLRKGASTQEKNEFLQEAKLMSQFQHKHVLRLLGVCLDTDPPLMLLELMAGGDLLSYLRNSRSLKPTDPSALRLQDLLSMCEDVARGCRYLEELHFVHRDLACRNCLVSARDRDNRVVKIGDFGLARDIYKNDYYRKEGEGLLPVRWMAPESLVDGVFTSQSDVWAFGVLMWEITSLGQQPYQARTNIEVLHHVRAGGRLPKPLNCPIRLHQLMLKCWSSVDARPSFKDCLEYILLLRNSTEDAVLSPVNQFHVNGNPYNRSSHFRANLSMQPLFQDGSDDTSKPTIEPKYSWLLDDEEDDSKDPRAAYEIPKSIPVAVQSATIDNNNDPNDTSRYIDICTEEGNDKGVLDDAASDQKSDIDSRTAHEDEEEEGWMDNRKRSSMASLGDSRSLKQLGSYAKLVGNGESVSSLSDWRRMKKVASDRRERTINDAEETRSNASTIVSYSTISFSQGSASLPRARLQRSKSSLQGARANIPLVINSGLLNILRQETEGLDEGDSDEVSYANVDSDTDKVTDL